jgi:hypothetical protein
MHKSYRRGRSQQSRGADAPAGEYGAPSGSVAPKSYRNLLAKPSHSGNAPTVTFSSEVVRIRDEITATTESRFASMMQAVNDSKYHFTEMLNTSMFWALPTRMVHRANGVARLTEAWRQARDTEPMQDAIYRHVSDGREFPSELLDVYLIAVDRDVWNRCAARTGLGDVWAPSLGGAIADALWNWRRELLFCGVMIGAGIYIFASRSRPYRGDVRSQRRVAVKARAVRQSGYRMSAVEGY